MTIEPYSVTRSEERGRTAPVLLMAISLLVFGFVTTAEAMVAPPMKIKMVGEPRPAAVGQTYEGSFDILSGLAATLEDVRVLGDGWSSIEVSPPASKQLDAGGSLRVDFRAVPEDPSELLIVEYDVDGRTLREEIDLSPEHVEPLRTFGGMREFEQGRIMPFPGVRWETVDSSPPKEDVVAPKDRDPELSHIGDESYDRRDTAEPNLQKKRSIRVYGRFVYERRDGITLGGDNVVVRVYDEDSSWDTKLAEGTTDSDGYFDFTFDWDPCFACDARPDIYVDFELDNHRVQVQSPVWEVDYSWATGTVGDYEGSSLNMGWWGPGDEGDMPAVFMFNNTYRAWRYIKNHQGRDTDTVDIQWPGSGNSAYYQGFWEEIHVSENRQWNDATHIHEYGHHFTENFATTQSPSYCNGICDDPGEWYELWIDDCGHCIWCPEGGYEAWNEGWANWLADLLTRRFDWEYGVDTLENRPQEDLNTCSEIGGGYGDPDITEGFLGALLRDIEDADEDDQAAFPDGKDELSLGADEIFDVTDWDQPTSPIQFLIAFKNRYPQHCEALWQTAANNGYDIDGANPGAPTALTSSSHPVGTQSADNTVKFNWNRPSDDCSGVAGYGVYITGSPSRPGPTVDIDADVTHYTTQPLNPGTYYFNLRAVDHAGNWSSTYSSYGPFTIREPWPANLTLSRLSGWFDNVVPRSGSDSEDTYVPAPTGLSGDATATYWNMRTSNRGESAAGTTTTVWAYSDGLPLLDLFNPGPYNDTVPDLGASTGFNSINQGPIYMKGGRHTFGARVDYGDVVAEIDETDNVWARQWVWTPVTLTPGESISRFAPPDRDGGWADATGTLWYNCYGVRFSSSGWWNAVVMVPRNDTTDFDLRLHEASTGPLDGFASNVGWSGRAAGCIDAVLVNRNVTGSVEGWDVGMLHPGIDPDPGQANLVHVTSESFSFGDSTVVSMDVGEALQLHEVFVSSSNAGSVAAVVEVDPADGPVYFQWLGENFSTGDLGDYDAWSVTDPATGRGRLDVNVPESSYNCLVIYRDPKDAGTQAIDLVVEVEISPPDWKPLKPTNWHAAVMPHPYSSDLSTIPAPSYLPGNQAETYISLSIVNDGPTGITDPFTAWTRIDGEYVTGSVWPSGWPADFQRVVHVGTPVTVDGGRHTLTLVCDPNDDYEEIDENNNVFGEQWIWTPLPLVENATVGRDQPSGRTVGWAEVSTGEPLWFNADGLHTPFFQPSGDDGYWGGVVVMPTSASDVDLRLHEKSTGAKSGFAANLGFSGWGPGQSDFVLMNFNQTLHRDFDAGVLDSGGEGGYQTEVVSSVFRGSPTGSSIGPFSMGAGRMLDLHEMQLEAGVHVIHLENLDGVVDYGMSLYADQEEFYAKSGGVADGSAWFEPAGLDEWITVDVATSGYYCLAVWKVGASDLALDGSYRLGVDGVLTSTPPGAGQGVATAIRAIRPNPFNPRTTVVFETSASRRAVVDVYSLRGELVRRLLDEPLTAGDHQVVWDGLDDRGEWVASGTYFVRLRSGGESDVRKAVLLK